MGSDINWIQKEKNKTVHGMKLLQYTNSKLTILLFFLIGIWGIIFFFAIHHEIMDETDDMLRSYRDIFVKKALNNPELLNSSYETTFDRYSIHPITYEEAQRYEESWLNDEVYFPEDDEHIPVRIYKSIFLASDGQYYELEINMSTMERDDMLQTLFLYLLILYILLLLCIITGNRIILKKTFMPLEKLLIWLNKIIPGKPVPELINDTQVLEFRQLNEAALALSKRNFQAYEQQKQFIENAAHELQTPLAVTLNKLELLSQSDNITENQLKNIDDIYRSLNKAIRLNKSLLLLSRIENSQFRDTAQVDIYKLIKELGEDLREIYSAKDIKLSVVKHKELIFPMNKVLSRVLFTNLLKNAFIHTPANGNIIVILQDNNVIIKNTGYTALDDKKIFQRFYRANDNDNNDSSTGLGLSIVKSICILCHIEICYHYDGEHIFELKFPL